MLVEIMEWKFVSMEAGFTIGLEGAMFTDLTFSLDFSQFLIDANISYEGFGWESFYQTWKYKLDKLKDDSTGFNFSESISEWVNWVANNTIAADKDFFEKRFCLLDFSSRDTFLKILDKYWEQYNILATDYESYEDFKIVIAFLQDMPYQLITTMEELHSKEKIPQEPCEQQNRENIFYQDDIKKKEQKYRMKKQDAGLISSINFFWGRCYGTA